jgi:hypothetical protein
LEVVTNESDASRVSGEDGPTRLQRVGIAIDPDEAGRGGRVEDAERMARPAERGVDECSWPLAERVACSALGGAVATGRWSSPNEGREEKVDDGAGKDGAVLHVRPISYLPSTLVAIASMPSAPPTEDPVRARSTIP